MEKLSDNQFVNWQKEHGPHRNQNVHPVTARKLFWETQTSNKFEQLGVKVAREENGFRQWPARDINFVTAPDFPAFDEAVKGLQEAVSYSTHRNGVIYQNGHK